MHHVRNGTIFILLLLGLPTLSGCSGGGETVISGIGNSGNHFGKEDEIAMLANALAAHAVIPRVSDEQIVQLYLNVEKNAFEGDMKATITVLRLAAYQRKQEQEEEQN